VDASRLILGCGNFGGIGSAPAFFGQGETREQAFALMDAAWEAGIRRFDTADAYGGGRSETWIGEWIRDRGLRPTLTTKVFHSVVGDPDDVGLAPERIRRQLHGSLERLGVDRVELYLTHERDAATPIADTLGELGQLREEGLVAAYGLSNVDVDELGEARGLAPVAAVQNSYSLLDREAEPLLDEPVAFQAFGPLAGGWLTGKYRRGMTSAPPGSRWDGDKQPWLGNWQNSVDERVWNVTDALIDVASSIGRSPAQVALRWLAQRPGVTAPIVGARTVEQLTDNLGATGWSLDEKHLEQLTTAGDQPLPYPHGYLAGSPRRRP
jgi:aryl-alcohol dehydrogenase-like predicted oxidoreductase